MHPTRLALLLAVPALVPACGGRSQAPIANGQAAADRRVAVVTRVGPSSEPAGTIPSAVAVDLGKYISKRVALVRGLSPTSADALPATCETGPADACLQAIGATTGATVLLQGTVEKAAADACSVSVSLATTDGPSPSTTTRAADRCRLQDLEAATEAAMAEHSLLHSLRSSPPPPHPPCEDICTAGEKSCDGRRTTVCGDGNWDGCSDWIPTPCAANHGCSKGACIADKPEMVLVGEGPFLMASGSKQLEHAMENCRARNYACVDSWWRPEQPAHWVQISGFYIDRTEVTNAAYADCVKAGRCKKPDLTKCGTWDPRRRDWIIARAGLSPDMTGPTKPAVCVSQDEADRYCKWAGKRLPTEAEWEKAARGTDSRLYPWGDTAYDGTQANGCDKRCGEIAGKGWRAETNLDDKVAYLAEVASYPAGASPYGALDMAGNVWEWVADWFDEDYYKVSERKDPTGPATPGERPLKVLRGGSWSNEPDSLRSSYRYSLEPTQRLVTVGFRCAYP